MLVKSGPVSLVLRHALTLVPLPTPSTFYYKTNYGVTYRITIAGYTI